MAVFRVERIKDYTVMSNHHLRNKNLSLKAKGLLSQMLSLPDDWDYTLKGLAAINKESVDAIRTAIWELEDAGYVVRTRVRDERGCLRGCDYYVYEYPQTPSSGSGGSAESVPPMLEPLASDSAVLGNPMQLNKEIQNKEKQNTDLILSEGEAVRTKVRDNIELDLLCRNQPESAPVMQEIYELVVETIQLRSPVLRLGSNLFPMALVRERLLQLTSEHIRFVLDGLRNLHTDVKNLKKYLLTMDEILASTPLGRKYTVKAKLRQSTAVASVIAFGTVLPHLWQVLRDYGLPSLLGPAMSISDLQAVPKFITLSDLLLFWLICRFAACLCMSRITLWLGQKLGNLLPALFISAVSYCLPALLSLSGMRNGIEWLGFYPLFHAVALWQNQGYTADGESYNAMWIPIFLVCAAFFLAWAIGQALIDDYDMIGVPDEVL